MHNHLTKYQEKYKIIFDYQSGFRCKHSVNTCPVHLSNQILKRFEERKSTGMILIDLQKAFDTLGHQILLKKLEYSWFSPETVRWFESYLKNQKSYCKPWEKPLRTRCFKFCFPQWSILGPILFLLYQARRNQGDSGSCSPPDFW